MTAKTISDSSEVREAVYSAWLAEKAARTSEERASKNMARKEEELRRQRRKVRG